MMNASSAFKVFNVLKRCSIQYLRGVSSSPIREISDDTALEVDSIDYSSPLSAHYLRSRCIAGSFGIPMFIIMILHHVVEYTGQGVGRN